MDNRVCANHSAADSGEAFRHPVRQILLDELPPDECEPPTKSELQLYALNELGVDLHQEPELADLALAGLTSPLPPDWKAVQLLLTVDCKDETADSESGWVYYYNSRSGQSTWEHPNDAKFRRRIARARLQHLAREAETNPEIESPCRVSQYLRRRRLSTSIGLDAKDPKAAEHVHNGPNHFMVEAHGQRVSEKPSERCTKNLTTDDFPSSCLDPQTQQRHHQCRQCLPPTRQRRGSISTLSTAADSLDSGFSSDQKDVKPLKQHPYSVTNENGPQSRSQHEVQPRTSPKRLPGRPLDWCRMFRRSNGSADVCRPLAAASQLPPSGCDINQRRFNFMSRH